MEISSIDLEHKSFTENKKNKQEEENILLPHLIHCTSCNIDLISYVSDEYNIYLWVYLVLIILIFGFFGLPLLVLIPLFKDKLHNCPDCLLVMKRISFYPINIKQNYMEITVDKCIIILKMTYVYVILILLVLYAVFVNVSYAMSSSLNTINNHLSLSPDSLVHSKISEIEYNKDTKWEDLIRLCGSKVIIENSARANEIFDEVFKGKPVKWKGHFLGYRTNPFESSHFITFYIKMIPSESINKEDISLGMDAVTFEKIKDIDLIRGDAVEFEGVLESLGNEWTSHHMHISSIRKIEEFVLENEKIVLFKGVNISIEGKRVSKDNKTSDNAN